MAAAACALRTMMKPRPSILISSIPNLRSVFTKTRIPNYHIIITPTTHLRRYCSHYTNPSHPSSSSQDQHQDPPPEYVLKAISDVSNTEEGGGSVTDDTTSDWLDLDRKVNSYPTVRGFTAIGSGGDDFVQAMVVAVESVLQQQIPEGQVKQKISSGGKYVSVNIGPVQVASGEQVQAVYNAMRSDDRVKYSL